MSNPETLVYLKKGNRMDRPEACPPEIYSLMKATWDENPACRPDFLTIRKKLEQIIERSSYLPYLNMDLTGCEYQNLESNCST
jgi:hypothetical protein